MKLTTAVKKNDRRATLEALRDIVADKIVGTGSARDIASLSKRLMEIEDKLNELPDPKADQNPLQKEKERVTEHGSKTT